MTPEELVARAPRLFHTTLATALPGLSERGLLPVETLVDLFEVADHERDALLARRRPTDVTLTHPRHGTAWIRDQAPMHEGTLARMLDDMSVEQYLRRLNSLAFLWADRPRLEGLHTLPRYADRPRAVLVLDTASVLAAHGDRVVCSRVNSGAALFARGRRGTHTLRPLAGFPARERLAEVAVAGGLPDLERHLVDVER